MELILKQDVEGLGFKDDVVTVKNGYGRNFLIPGGKAILVSPGAPCLLACSCYLVLSRRAAVRPTSTGTARLNGRAARY